MAASGRLNIRWEGFEVDRRIALGELRTKSEFFDVTLVASDGMRVQANKLILANGSSFFYKILTEDPQPHPMIYLTGVKYKDLSSLLNYLYTGEANIFEEDLNQFLDIAEEFQIRELTPSDKQKTKSLPKTLDTLQSQVSPDEHVLSESKSFSPNFKSAPIQSQVSAHSVMPAPHQGQMAAEKHASSPRESFPHGMTPSNRSNTFPPSASEDDTFNVKVEVNDAEHFNVMYGMNEQGEQYINNISNSDTVITKAEDDVITSESSTHDWNEDGEENDENMNEDGDYEPGEPSAHVWYEEGGENEDVSMTEEGEHYHDCRQKYFLHKKSHADEKQFHCLICSKSFSTFQNLNIHKRTHTGEKPYQCLICSKRFSQSSTLNQHLRNKKKCSSKPMS